MNWKNFLNNKKSVYELVITLILLVIVLSFFPKFLSYVEARNGTVLPDPILIMFNPIDLTWLTFALIYLSVIIAIINFAPNPIILLKAFQCYALMVIFRMAAMYITPLNPPENMLVLNDPFVQFFGNGEILTKDLFFSGHTATLFLLFLLVDKRRLKIIFLINTAIVGTAVLLQHVHYTIDVLAAPFFAYGSYRVISVIRKKLSLTSAMENI